jgi:3-hydroxy-9,10-secoandrosta-1,3,5(10)-triene-9,17-dione monooxygenase reductase component
MVRVTDRAHEPDAWLEELDFELRPGEPSHIDRDDVHAVERAQAFRDVLGRFATGVAVVTAMSDGEPVGMTCQSFSSVSLSPPLVLFCPARTSRAWPLIQRAGSFCVNLLADGQHELSNIMATKGIDKFADIGWEPTPRTGSPLLKGVLGFVDCTIHAVHEAGDHYVVLGRVQELESYDEVTDPLLYYEGRYRSTGQ